MKTFLKTFFLFSLIIIGVSCSKNRITKETKPVVVVSVAPYKYFVDKIALGRVETIVLVPSNANPHAYEPTARLIEKAREGKLWFRVGENFETKLLTTLTLPKVDLRNGVELIEDRCCHNHLHKSADVHTWLSPKVALKQVEMIRKALVDTFPEYSKEFDLAAMSLCDELQTLDKEISITFSKAPSKNILVSHAAFAYLCRDYGLQQFSIEQEGKEPTIKQVVSLTHLAKEKNFHFILTQAQHDNKGAVRLSKELEIPCLLIDPYSEDYTSNLKKIADTICQGLQL